MCLKLFKSGTRKFLETNPYLALVFTNAVGWVQLPCVILLRLQSRKIRQKHSCSSDFIGTTAEVWYDWWNKLQNCGFLQCFTRGVGPPRPKCPDIMFFIQLPCLTSLETQQWLPIWLIVTSLITTSINLPIDMIIGWLWEWHKFNSAVNYKDKYYCSIPSVNDHCNHYVMNCFQNNIRCWWGYYNIACTNIQSTK